MPRKSERKLLLFELNKTLKELALDSQESTKDFAEILEIAASLSSTRFLNPRTFIPKSDGWTEILWHIPEGQFRQLVRMDQISFVRLLAKIEDNRVFHNESLNAQEKTWIQLSVALNRLGCYGNGASIGRIAFFSGYSYGTVINFTNRVISAICELTAHYVYWPDAAQRERIAQRFLARHGLYKCVGIVDGTPVIFSQRPGVDGETCYDRYFIILYLVLNA